jgi:hypothetical protein
MVSWVNRGPALPITENEKSLQSQVLDVARALVDLRAAVSLLAIDSQRKDAVMKEMEDLGVSIDAVLEKAKNLVQSNG